MAKVYSGKVVIPGDKIAEYLKIITNAEKKREPFRRYLLDLNQDFYAFLQSKFSQRTARKHSFIVELFIDFVCRQTDVEKIDEITKGMVKTHFRNWWRRKVLDSTTPDELRGALRKFFKFLAEEKGILNEKALNALQ
ncbi:MAG: site-specific integrase [Thermodesulfobacteriota bacterium]